MYLPDKLASAGKVSKLREGGLKFEIVSTAGSKRIRNYP